MDANVEPFKMADGKLTAVKVEHHGQIEVIELDPTPFTEFHIIVSLVREYLKARLEHAVAQSKFEDARDVLAATTENFENAQRKMKFLQLSTIQTSTVGIKEQKLAIKDRVIITEPQDKPLESKLDDIPEMTRKMESFADMADRHHREMEESLKEQEQSTQKQTHEAPRRIVIGADISGLIKKETEKTKPPQPEAPVHQEPPREPAPLILVQKPIESEPLKLVVIHPTSARGWAEQIYDDVIIEIKRRTKGDFTDNDLIIEVTRKGVSPELVMNTVDEIVNLMKEKKLFEDKPSFLNKLFHKKK